MNRTEYEDYKYIMQDTSNLYIGAKYTFEEIMEDEEIYFKFRLILKRYIIPEVNIRDSIETHLYYLNKNSFLVKIYDHLKVRIKVNLIEEKRTLFGKVQRKYVTKTLKIHELVQMSTADKERCGMVIQELKVSKVAIISM